MAGTGGASSMVELESEGSCDLENGSCDSESRNKRIKSGEEEEDRFSALPDFLVHRILSVLPATDLVKTCVLSKWWNNQWNRVPVLNFVPDDGMSSHKFSNFIDKTLILHDSPNIDKFLIKLKSFPMDDQFPNFDLWIRFAVRKYVKELIVNFNNDMHPYVLPQFLFNNSSLVKLKFTACNFSPIGKVNWYSVKCLRLYRCDVEHEAIANVLAGSPLLEYLEFCSCYVYEGLVIASKSLKTLILDGLSSECNVVEISCPNLDRLRISDLAWFISLKIMNLPSSVYATLDFYYELEDQIEESEDEEEQLGDNMSHGDCVNLVLKTLQQVEHVEKLEIGRWLLEILSSSKEDGDGIGGLPDSFIHQIISFLPSTKDACIHKRWQRKWADVPIINFVSNEKFVIDSKDIPLVDLDPKLSLWIRFAARKDVKELILDCDGANVESGHEYPLPQFLFNNSSLVKMKLCGCDFMPNGKVNWESLKSLRLDHSELGNQAIEHVLSGSPLLECLELHCCGFEGEIVVASEHLKTFMLEEFGKNSRLVEISCPNLESLKIWGNLGPTSLKFMNLPSSLHATLDLYVLDLDGISPDNCMNLVEETMKQILHVEELEIVFRRLKR